MVYHFTYLVAPTIITLSPLYPVAGFDELRELPAACELKIKYNLRYFFEFLAFETSVVYIHIGNMLTFFLFEYSVMWIIALEFLLNIF